MTLKILEWTPRSSRKGRPLHHVNFIERKMVAKGLMPSDWDDRDLWRTTNVYSSLLEAEIGTYRCLSHVAK